MSTESARPDFATALIRPDEPHGEVLDPATSDVWQSLEPITPDAYRALPLEPGWVRVGLGLAAMDEHWFTRSPGRDEDGPMQERKIGGHRFGLCARPASAPSQPAGPSGPRMLRVDKHHVVRFARGREVDTLVDAGGSRYVHVIEGGEDKAPLALPDGWRREPVSLTEGWVVALPAPATVFFFPNGDSYQGPIDAPAR